MGPSVYCWAGSSLCCWFFSWSSEGRPRDLQLAQRRGSASRQAGRAVKSLGYRPQAARGSVSETTLSRETQTEPVAAIQVMTGAEVLVVIFLFAVLLGQVAKVPLVATETKTAPLLLSDIVAVALGLWLTASVLLSG